MQIKDVNHTEGSLSEKIFKLLVIISVLFTATTVVKLTQGDPTPDQSLIPFFVVVNPSEKMRLSFQKGMRVGVWSHRVLRWYVEDIDLLFCAVDLIPGEANPSRHVRVSLLA